MFLIVDNTKRKLRNETKFKFNSINMPCVICDLDHCDVYMPAALVIVTEEYLLKDVEYIASFHGKMPIVLWDEKTDLFDFALNTYKRLYDIDILNARIRFISIMDGEICYCGRSLRLTKTEDRIMKYLLLYAGWHNRDLVARYCLKRGYRDRNAVPVHICNLNKKLQRRTNVKIIQYKRNVGYCI